VSVRITRNFGRLADIPLGSETLMREVGLLVRERIVRRTLSGQDQDEAPFAPYSARYAAQKAEALGGAGTVNLQVSGQMLQGITITECDAQHVALGFKD
jgi:hypothetical protein